MALYAKDFHTSSQLMLKNGFLAVVWLRVKLHFLTCGKLCDTFVGNYNTLLESNIG